MPMIAPGNRGRDLPAEEFLADVVVDRDGDAHHRMSGVLPARRRPCPARHRARTRAADRRTGGRRRRRRASPSGSRSTGMMPLPCLPVDSASKLLEPGAEIGDAGEATMVTLSRPACASTPRIAPSSTPGLSAGGTSRPQAAPSVPCVSRDVATSRPIDGGRHHAEGRQHRVAAADARHRRGTHGGSRSRSATFSSVEPGSVMATKCDAGVARRRLPLRCVSKK